MGKSIKLSPESPANGKKGLNVMGASFFDQPILDSPYEMPTEHHHIGESGQPIDLPPIKCRFEDGCDESQAAIFVGPEFGTVINHFGNEVM